MKRVPDETTAVKPRGRFQDVGCRSSVISGEITGHYVSIGKLAAYYEEAGRGRPIVCLHTAGSDSRVWKYFAELFRSDYRVICPDLPGHGKTLPPLSSDGFKPTLSFYSDFVYRLIRKLDLKKPIVVGCSIGGNISLILGVRYPELPAAIVCAEGGGMTRTFPGGSIPVRDPDLENTIRRCSRKTPRSRVREIMWMRHSSPMAVYHGDLLAWNSQDIQDQLGLIAAPVLLLRGKEDPGFKKEMLDATKRRIEDCEAIELDDCGHFPMIENPEVFGGAVKNFLVARKL